MLRNYITMHGAKNIQVPKVGTYLSVFCNSVIPLYSLRLNVSTESCHLHTHEQDYYKRSVLRLSVAKKLRLKYIYIYLNLIVTYFSTTCMTR
jgi:hypothetical protein